MNNRHLIFASTLTLSLLLAACASDSGTPPLRSAASASEPAPAQPIRFTDATAEAGIPNGFGGKYNGPSISDINQDGLLDAVIANHDDTPPQLLMNNGDGTFTHVDTGWPRADWHGIAPGDMDGDGDLDLLISVGGGNATAPKPPHLYRNDNGRMVDITRGSGLDTIGARGRAVRWIDLDGDGDLDVLNANESIPGVEDQDYLPAFENDGTGKFTYRRLKGLEGTHENTMVVFDYNGDGISDLLFYPTLELKRGNGDWSFTDVTESAFSPEVRAQLWTVAAADPDIDNDGDPDIYLARGLRLLQMANRGFIFREDQQTINMRQRGDSGGHDGFDFISGDTASIERMGHVRYRWRDPVPLYLGAAKTKIVDPQQGSFTVSAADAMGFPDDIGTGVPEEENGWYLGYLGEGRWRLEYFLMNQSSWSIFATLNDVEAVISDTWVNSDYGKPDMLLRNDGGTFTDISDQLPAKARNEANHGVTYGDFDNDGLTDLFVFRYGHLNWRREDWVLRNTGAGFELVEGHGGTVLTRGGVGDNGAAFDYDNDGAVDVLTGDEDAGYWALNRNQLVPDASSNFVHVRVGYSPGGVDPLGARIVVTAGDLEQTQQVRSRGASFSQGAMSVAHFGLGPRDSIDRVTVRWRDGSEAMLEDQSAGGMLTFGTFPGGS